MLQHGVTVPRHVLPGLRDESRVFPLEPLLALVPVLLVDVSGSGQPVVVEPGITLLSSVVYCAFVLPFPVVAVQ